MILTELDREYLCWLRRAAKFKNYSRTRDLQRAGYIEESGGRFRLTAQGLDHVTMTENAK